MNLDVDFLLVPSEAELQDTSSDDTYSGPLFHVHQSCQALENECRDIIQRWSDVTVQWASGEDPWVSNYAPTNIVTTAVAWIGSAAGASLLYKLLKLWVGTRKRRILVKLPGGLHIETTHMSAKQFVGLLEKLAELGLVTTESFARNYSGRGKGDRVSYVPEESEKAFKRMLDAAKADGIEVLDANAMAAQERTLSHIFARTLDELRDCPDIEERTHRFRKYVDEWIAKGRPAPYLTSPEERDELLDKMGSETKTQSQQETVSRSAKGGSKKSRSE